MKLQILATALVLSGFTTACQTHPTTVSDVRIDRSLASALYLSETDYLDRQADGDALGMARAARSRLDLIEQLDPNAVFGSEAGDTRRQDRRTTSLLASVRDMVFQANRLAQNDRDTLARIERLFPKSQTAQRGGLGNFSGLIRKRRAVKVTIGLELDATLDAKAEEHIRLPVDRQAGTTIYVQTAGQYTQDISSYLAMNVTRRVDNSLEWEDVSCPAASGPRLPCYVPPGDHSEIEIRLANRSAGKIDALIFVSGNAESVAASIVEP